ncbi:hypothetical protein EGX98_06040 [Fusobacterium necrophorum]|uniref:Adhesion protein FadA n=1 Tax=Fusobacterium necrophorum BL TaxID=1441732 RepID=A0AB73BWG8_9FUSO|nr:adhesion protein FadA [Fusobacterium necrophorum]AYZ73614.1 hypothetical protein EGX98_06040 [Fusobacterium necrophorum]AZW08383.1 hypothetical protein EO219_01340 [Fusobacterium necrophorum subsp. necrophorum]KDE62565.1 hypothetical protein FUSO3_07585 [Fusobacterium necrophorum BL]SDB49414.1 Adhesion protein FadA [Fusobacterium necrophorum]SQD09284.1 Adhesion protein FadA [Fusobacterium necrophorum subsp. necrophorum]
MKRTIFLCISILLLSVLSYSQDNIMETISSIDTEYQELLAKEEEKKVEFTNEKAKLEEELVKLKEKQQGKEKVFEKLQKDAEIRWHRDEYKKLLKRYEEYYKKLIIGIEEREAKIAELEKLLSIMSE